MTNTYKQNGYTLTLNANRVSNGKHKFITVLTMMIKKKNVESYYMLVDNDGKRPPYATIKRLITDNKYRKSFLVEGYAHCDINFSYENSKGINYDCVKSINKFKSKLKTKDYLPTIEDYKMVKSYGKDSLSLLDISALEERIKDKRFIDKVHNVFTSEEHIESTLRWYLRGLPQHHAIQKELIHIVEDNEYRERFIKTHLDANLVSELGDTSKSKSKQN